MFSRSGVLIISMAKITLIKLTYQTNVTVSISSSERQLRMTPNNKKLQFIKLWNILAEKTNITHTSTQTHKLYWGIHFPRLNKTEEVFALKYFMTFSLHRGQPLFYLKYARQIGAFPQGDRGVKIPKNIFELPPASCWWFRTPKGPTTLDGAKTRLVQLQSHQPSHSPSGSPSRMNARRETSAVSSVPHVKPTKMQHMG